MPARIRRDDIAAVRERARIEEVVAEHVTLRSAGVGSMKGLCPFHDERTPSFHVRPQVGLWHCFGCSEGGDVISFVQKVDHLTFTDAVERLGARYNVPIRFEEDGTPGSARPREEPGRRQRLVEAHRVAAEFFAEQLLAPEAVPGRTFLAERGFDRSAAATFGVGYAPQGWDALMRHLSGRGFTQAELAAAGLVSQGNRGYYDRFRGRLIWPIRDLTGDVIGFGARRLYEDDPGPKYLNTPETAIYHKAQVLYGIDLAKKAIVAERKIVVVEGYTDVMACHLAGVSTAVATCGTAFGSDHVRIARRLLGDAATGASGVLLSSGHAIGGEVIFTFDGDAAGQKAARRAFGEDQNFAAQTFVAVSAEGMDPCEVRVAKGDVAVRDLVAGRTPLFEFAIRSVLAELDLGTAEGRVAGLRAAVPVIATIRDHALREEYARQLAGWVGMDPVDVRRAVQRAARSNTGRPSAEQTDSPSSAAEASTRVQPTPVPTDPIERLERQVLEVALQAPAHAGAGGFDTLAADAFAAPVHQAVFLAIQAAGGVRTGADGEVQARWLAQVLEGVPDAVATFVRELTVASLPIEGEEIGEYARGVVGALRRMGITRRIAETKSRALALPPGGEAEALWARAAELEEQRRRLVEQD